MAIACGPIGPFCLVCGKGWDGSYDDLLALGFNHDQAVEMTKLAGGTPGCYHIGNPSNRSDAHDRRHHVP